MNRKALLVGVNKYKMAGSDLNGCINDVTNIRHALITYFGYSVKEIRVVTDDRATRANIMKRLEWLVKGAEAGDRLLFHFSGHGSQIRDRDGDELKDHLDEIICPHDMDWDGTYIVDDDLKKIFSKLRTGVNLDVLLDCCHSGTATREMVSVSEEPTVRSRFLRPPVDILCREEEGLSVKKLMRGNPAAINHVLFSGCKDNQTSADAYINGAFNGAFTYYFCKHIRDANADLNRSELLKRLRASLKFNHYDQVPQLEGPKNKMKRKLLE